MESGVDLTNWLLNGFELSEGVEDPVFIVLLPIPVGSRGAQSFQYILYPKKTCDNSVHHLARSKSAGTNNK